MLHNFEDLELFWVEECTWGEMAIFEQYFRKTAIDRLRPNCTGFPTKAKPAPASLSLLEMYSARGGLAWPLFGHTP